MSLFKNLNPFRSQNAAYDHGQTVGQGRHHAVNGNLLDPPFPVGSEEIILGLGCFWGAERKFWQWPQGVYVTCVGYAGGLTRHPTYQDVCTGRSGHAEVVRVVYFPDSLKLEQLLKLFWESHDPTQGNRQGNDVGAQYRSVIFTTTQDQQIIAETSRAAYQRELSKAGFGAITTEIAPAPVFYYAEDYHQQYLAKNPNGYCGLGGTGVSCLVDNVN